jgi:hypothetical protein
MEGIDFRTLLTIGGLLITVTTSFAITRTQLATVMKEVGKVAAALQDVVHRADRESADQSVLEARVRVLADILSPSNLKTENREAARLLATVEALRDEVQALRGMHTGSHP